MTDKDAVFLLGACPPNGGTSDPEFAEALTQAERDPALKAWLEDQRRFDSAVASRLQAVPVPADLRERILAGGRVSRPTRWASGHRLWVIAAMIAVFAGVGLWSLTRNRPEKWEDRSISAVSEILSGREKFDAESSRVADLQQWLHRAGSPGAAAALPDRLRGLASLGCKTVSWKGHPISIICFHGPGGELVHLAMVDRAALNSPPPEGHPEYETRDGWCMACWSQGDLAMMLVTKAPESQLRAILSVILAL